ncbi:MAG TPA: ABC transporter ATP-binding protein [Leucothrix sp.]|nr:ABC transporter ATP-binding protein [Leucothrix sp.]HIQ16255.1 ABC transporter ATP-binding protein [Leucothrix sp.]
MVDSDSANPSNSSTSLMAIDLRGISKAFGAVQANKNVNFAVPKGTIHGIVGENGAGKSTLMSILYGFYEADSGDIYISGKKTRIRNSTDAIAAGIGMVHQHFMLVDNFTALENIMLGAESGVMLSKSIVVAAKELERLDSEFGLHINKEAETGKLPVGQQQRVEILKALYRGAEILILDEPTGVLTPQEADQLFDILKSLKKRGVTIIIITHKLREIMDLTDNVSIMRRGEIVANVKTSETSREELAEFMVGRKVRMDLDKMPANPQETLLRVKSLTVKDEYGINRVDNVSFEVRAGEIVGIAGVSGNGQSELLEILSGIRRCNQGEVVINGEIITPKKRRNPEKIRASKIAHVPEDRLKRGLVLPFSASESSLLGYHKRDLFNGAILTDSGAIKAHCMHLMDEFDVRPKNPSLKSANFSGGNQQKLILAREMDLKPQVLLVGQPTRGVDIGAIEFIHKQILNMRDAGSAILLVSGELDELMLLADRILVMFEGRIVGEVNADEADETTLGLMMANSLSNAPEQEVRV